MARLSAGFARGRRLTSVGAGVVAIIPTQHAVPQLSSLTSPLALFPSSSTFLHTQRSSSCIFFHCTTSASHSPFASRFAHRKRLFLTYHFAPSQPHYGGRSPQPPPGACGGHKHMYVITFCSFASSSHISCRTGSRISAAAPRVTATWLSLETRPACCPLRCCVFAHPRLSSPQSTSSPKCIYLIPTPQTPTPCR
jgi:hypothetical protein